MILQESVHVMENRMPVSPLPAEGIGSTTIALSGAQPHNTLSIHSYIQGSRIADIPDEVLDWLKDAELTKNKVIPTLLELEFSSSDDMEDAGFPFDVPDELTESQGRDLSRVIARGVPDRDWVEAVRAQLDA